MAATKQPGSLGGKYARPTIDAGTLCRAPSPVMGSVGVPGVKDWPIEKRLMEVTRLAAPQLPGEMRDQFLAMFTPANIGIMVGFIAVVVGAHLSPFAIAAIIADGLTFLVGLVLVGTAIVSVARDIATFVERTQNATVCRDLEIAAAALARAVSVLGVTILMAFIARGAARSVRAIRGAPTNAGAAPAAPRAPKLYEMVKIEHTGEGAMAEAMRKAAVRELTTEKLIADNPHWQMQTKPGRLKSRGGVKPDGEPIRPREIVESHVKGHKLTAPMGQRTLPAGTEIIQFVRADGKAGVWCAYPGARPRDLAILAKGRIQMRFIVEKPLTIWESTAAPFEAGKVPGVGGRGGGLQLLMPQGWRNNVRTVWERGAASTFGTGAGAGARDRR